ncbi:MAG TPA: DUF4350 domain-containing protein [Dyella sp.]|uniref:DUF4350 domain-containing protein n=1 Tax=Dyella sp. TaxID=1869338 RepID=UPI002F9472C9
MNRASVTILLIVLGVLGLGALGFFTNYERRLVDSYDRPSGEARYNRFFALQRTLEQLHAPVKSVTTLDPGEVPLKTGDTVVLGGDLSNIDNIDAQRLGDWVREGGNLVLDQTLADANSHTPLMQQFKLLQSKIGAYGCNRIATGPGKEDRFDLCGRRMQPAAHATVEASVGDSKDGYLMLRMKAGQGTVNFLNMYVLVNSELRGVPQQRFVRRLLEPGFGEGKFYLVYELDGPSFWVKLITQGWPALLALTLLLLAWAFAHGERLGPVIPLPPLRRRALLEHVQAVGEFLFRRDNGYTLHGMACRSVLAHVRRVDPLCAALNDDALHRRLAERYRLDPAQVARAFQPPANAPAFRDSLAILARLRSRP